MSESHDHGITSSHHVHGITSSDGHGQPAPQVTAEEWDQYSRSDQGAGRAVVMLMAGIFTIGLALYAVVAYVCWFKVM
jgi:hypothetical protein